MSEIWRTILNDLIARSKSPRLMNRDIVLTERKGQFWPWWFPYAWIVPVQNTFTIGRVIVLGHGLDGLDNNGKRYIIAHELGHIAWRHGAKAAAGLGIVALSLVIRVPLVALGLFVFGVCMLTLTKHYAEYQADRFAARLIGPGAVLHGMKAIDQYLDRKPGIIRKKRMAALQKMRDNK